ncbi:hypothetical protein [Streptomyces alboflavus]|uniref:hypothetical protein n=1 Tax=Streptomyces alboflavus TaxID=67267 RepID=UPI000F657F0D|nr:hypothetical protein [Streptomyces alboflavus]
MGTTKPEEQLDAQQWLGQALDALTTDELWTRLLATPMDASDMPAAARVGEQLRLTWRQLTTPHALDSLDHFLTSYRDQGVETARVSRSEAVHSMGLDDPDRFAILAQRATDALRALRDQQTEELTVKIDALTDHSWQPPGDLSPSAWCALILGALLSALALQFGIHDYLVDLAAVPMCESLFPNDSRGG